MRLRKVPGTLTAIDRWRLVDKDKRPLAPDGRIDRSEDSLLCFHEATELIRVCPRATGLAFEFGDPLIGGIDLDGCRNPGTGKVDEWAVEIVKRFNSYAEVSPSGTGIKIFFLHDEAGTYEQPWTQFAMEGAQGGKSAGIEAYVGGTRYFAVTGKRVQGFADLNHAEDAVEWLFSKYQKPVHAPPSAPLEAPRLSRTHDYDLQLSRAQKYVEAIPGAPEGQRDAMLWRIATVCWRFGLDSDDSCMLMRGYNERCDPPEKNIERRVQHKLSQVGKCKFARGDLAAMDLDSDRVTEILDRDDVPFIYVRQSELTGNAVRERLRAGHFDLQSTGILALDDALEGGMPLNGVVAVMGRPSHGKTALILHCLQQLAGQGNKCLYISKEMSIDEILARRISSVEESPRAEWRHRADAIADRMQDLPGSDNLIYVDSCDDLDEIEACIRHAALVEQVNTVAVDYLQRIPVLGTDGEYERVSQASMRLANLARELRITLYLAVQMNRARDFAGRTKVYMSDARGSGQIEQDVDLMLHVEWPYIDDCDEPEDQFKITVLKSRFKQPTEPTITISWDHRRQEFEVPPGIHLWEPEFDYEEAIHRSEKESTGSLFRV